MTVFASLFFSSSAHPRDLPSFPTRRSSDLPADQAVTKTIEFYNKLRTAHPGKRIVIAEFGWPSGDDDPFADRKSTRLNSSHLGISYAVFCLKKKKNK